MRITVLGKSPAWQDAGGACSGYLVEAGGAALLLDCGNGVFGKLRAARDFTRRLRGRHLSPARRSLHRPRAVRLCARVLAPGERRAAGRPPLYAPPGARETFRRITGAWDAEELIEQAFELHEYDPAGELDARPAARALPRGPALHPHARGASCAPAAAASPTAPTAARTRRSSRSRATATC